MKKTILIIIILIIIGFGFNFLFQDSENNDNKEMENKEENNGQESPSETLKIETLKDGSGEEIQNGEQAVVHYVGTLENGEKFDSSIDRGQPFSFELGAGMVIQGWELGILGMKVGEKRKLTIPSDLGYGAAGTPGGPIPPNATLIFEVELVGILK